MITKVCSQNSWSLSKGKQESRNWKPMYCSHQLPSSDQLQSFFKNTHQQILVAGETCVTCIDAHMLLPGIQPSYPWAPNLHAVSFTSYKPICMTLLHQSESAEKLPRLWCTRASFYSDTWYDTNKWTRENLIDVEQKKVLISFEWVQNFRSMQINKEKWYHGRGAGRPE